MQTSDRAPAWPALRADWGRYLEPDRPLWSQLGKLSSRPGAWVSLVYRSGCWIYHQAPRPVAAPLKLLWKAADLLVQGLLDVHISPACRIGPGLHLARHGGIWINPWTRMGSGCSIEQGLVIGVAGPHPERAPVIGNGVCIGPGVVITGAVQVGSGSLIAARSLIVNDVPPGATVMGVPGRVLRQPEVPASLAAAVQEGSGPPAAAETPPEGRPGAWAADG